MGKRPSERDHFNLNGVLFAVLGSRYPLPPWCAAFCDAARAAQWNDVAQSLEHQRASETLVSRDYEALEDRSYEPFARALGAAVRRARLVLGKTQEDVALRERLERPSGFGDREWRES